jgi:hypothetical protein
VPRRRAETHDFETNVDMAENQQMTFLFNLESAARRKIKKN